MSQTSLDTPNQLGVLQKSYVFNRRSRKNLTLFFALGIALGLIGIVIGICVLSEVPIPMGNWKPGSTFGMVLISLGSILVMLGIGTFLWERSGFSRRIEVYDSGLIYHLRGVERICRWPGVRAIRWVSSDDESVLELFPKEGNSFSFVSGCDQNGIEMGPFTRPDILELVSILRSKTDGLPSPPQWTDTLLSVAVTDEGVVTGISLRRAFAIIALAFSWAPVFGLGLSIAALAMNWRLRGWTKIVSWIALTISILIIGAIVICLIAGGKK